LRGQSLIEFKKCSAWKADERKKEILQKLCADSNVNDYEPAQEAIQDFMELVEKHNLVESVFLEYLELFYCCYQARFLNLIPDKDEAVC
jgi:hypothetical protein